MGASYLYETVEACILAATHLRSCDNDGYCNACGEQTMDPDAAWDEAVAIADAIWNVHPSKPDVEPDEQRLAELVLSLQDWVKNGGFPPKVFSQPK